MISLYSSDRIVAAWCDHTDSGHPFVEVLIRAPGNVLRTEMIHAEELTPQMRALFEVGASVHRQVTGAAIMAVGVKP